MRPWPEPGARKEEEAMKKLFALLMALTMTVQLVTPAWADAVEEGPEESTEAVEVVQETTEATEETEVPEETEAETEETEATEEVTEPEETTEETSEAEPTEETEEALPEAGVVEDVAALEAGVVASGTCGENVTWVLDNKGTMTISGNGPMRICDSMLWRSVKGRIVCVEIEHGVDSIPEEAFSECTELRSVKLPESLSQIGRDAFSKCTSLTNIHLPESLESISRSVFEGCTALRSVVIPGKVTVIESCAFAQCAQLKDIMIPETVTSIGGGAFAECINLSNVAIPESVQQLGSAFVGCSNLTNITLPSGIECIRRGTFSGCSNLKRVDLPDSLVTIESSAFAGCTSLEEINLPCNVFEIGDSAFSDCSGLQKIVVPENVKIVGEYAFSGCANVVVVDYQCDITNIKTGSFQKCSNLKRITIPDGVLTIGNEAFSGCKSLEYVEIPKSVTLLGEAVFRWCKSLKKIEIPDGVSTMSNELFYGCSNLKTVIIPESVDKIGKDVFYGCNDLQLIDIDCVPDEISERITHLDELVTLPEFLKQKTSGNAYLEWSVRWIDGEAEIAKSGEDGCAVLWKHSSGSIVLWCYDSYTGASGHKTIRLVTNTEIRPTTECSIVSGESAKLSIWAVPEGNELTARWSIPEEYRRYATISDDGMVVAKPVNKPTDIIVRADPTYGEKSQEKTIHILPKTVGLSILADGEVTGNTLIMDLMEKRVLGLTAQIQPEGAMTTVTWTSDAPEVASVDEDGMVTLLKPGTAVIQAASTDGGASAQLTLRLIQPGDKAPRLDSNKLTLNANLTAGTTTALVESYNNTIQSVTLYDYDKTRKRYEEAPSDSFTAEAEDGTLTVRALSAQKNGTYQLKLVITCLGGSYDYTLQVKVANSLPKVTVKQIGKFDTFYLDSTAQLTATASGYEVERMELIGGDTFRMDEDGNLFYAESYNPGDKVVTKGTLLVYVEGYQVPVKKNVTVATTKTAPKLTLNPSASAVNRTLEDPEFRVKVLWKGNALDMTDAEVTPDVGFATVEAQGQYLVFRLTGTTGGTARLSLRLPGWAQAVSLTHKVTVENKLPSVKLGVTTLKLNSLFSAQTAETSVWLTQGNLDISTMDFKAAREEGNCIDLSFDPETDSIEAKFKGIPKAEMPKAGTYSYTYTAYLENGTALPSGTIKVTVAATAPKVKLSAASVKLNRHLAGQEKATVKVTLTGGTGYQVTDFEGLPDYMRYDAETSELTVVLPDETFTGETCTLCPIVREEESGQEVQLPTKLTLKVRTLNTNKLTVSLSAKGKLNTVDPDSAIAYMVTKVNNCLGTVEGVDLAGQDGDRFQADLDTSGVKPIVLLRLLPGESYATNKTYKVRFRFTVCGKEVLSSVLSVKVTQTALKVTAPKTAVYYLSQSGPLRCSLKANLPLESVALSTRTAKEFQQALGGQENLRLTGNRVEFKLTNPGALTAGKSYSVQLELTPENAAENTKPTTIKLTVKVMK